MGDLAFCKLQAGVRRQCPVIDLTDASNVPVWFFARKILFGLGARFTVCLQSCSRSVAAQCSWILRALPACNQQSRLQAFLSSVTLVAVCLLIVLGAQNFAPTYSSLVLKMYTQLVLSIVRLLQDVCTLSMIHCAHRPW